MSKKVTAKQVIATLRSIVRVTGEDHRYSGLCDTPHKQEARIRYSYEDCIAGCVIRGQAPEVHEAMLAHEKNWHSGFSLRSMPQAVESELRSRFTPKAIEVMQVAQVTQDSGGSWGDALKLAEKAAGA